MLVKILISVLIGAVSGWLASIIMKTKGGLLRNIIIGVLGGAVGGYLFNLLGLSLNINAYVSTIIVSVIGACLLIFIVNKIFK